MKIEPGDWILVARVSGTRSKKNWRLAQIESINKDGNFVSEDMIITKRMVVKNQPSGYPRRIVRIAPEIALDKSDYESDLNMVSLVHPGLKCLHPDLVRKLARIFRVNHKVAEILSERPESNQ